MANQQSQALTKRSMDVALMPPPPAPKRQKRPAKVLDEDVYSDAVNHIIARDFFPGLLESEAQSDFLSAIDSHDKDWIRESGRKLTQVMTPGPNDRYRRGTSFTPRRTTNAGETPRGWIGQTPGRTPATPSVSGEEQAAPEVDVNMSLDSFAARYTGEDNESFNALLDKQNEKRAAKHAFYHHGNNIPSGRLLAWREKEQNQLEEKGSNAQSTALIKSSSDSAENRLSVATQSSGPSQDLDRRPASVDSFPNQTGTGPRNTFMFGPNSIEDTHLTHAQRAQERSLAPPKATNYAGTRFTAESAAQREAVPPSPSMSAIDAAIAGRPRPTASEPGYSGAETPRVNGYAFVDAEPTPSELGEPVSDAEADAAERDAALALLPKADKSGPNPFSIKTQSKREDLRDRLVEKADQARRKSGKGQVEELARLGITSTPGRMATPRFASAEGLKKKGGAAAMTPAARMLAHQLRTPRKGW